MSKKNEKLKFGLVLISIFGLVFAFYAGLYLTSSRAFRMVQSLSDTFERTIFFLMAERLGQLGDDIGQLAGSLDIQTVDDALSRYFNLTGLLWVRQPEVSDSNAVGLWSAWLAGKASRTDLVRAFSSVKQQLNRIQDGLNTAFSLAFLLFGLMLSLSIAGSIAFYTTLKRSKLEEKLTREMFHQNLLAEEKTRKAVARELYEGLAQDLAAVRLLFRQGGTAAGTGAVDKALAVLDAVDDKIRDLSAELRPPELGVLGLGLVLKGLCNEIRHKTAYDLRFEGKDHLPRLPEEIELNLYRIMYEAIINATKHADRGKAVLNCRLTRQSSAEQGPIAMLVLNLHDAGFSPDPSVPAAEYQNFRNYGLGMKMMLERAAKIGAALDFSINPDGSEVRLMLDIMPYIGAGAMESL